MHLQRTDIGYTRTRQTARGLPFYTSNPVTIYSTCNPLNFLSISSSNPLATSLSL